MEKRSVNLYGVRSFIFTCKVIEHIKFVKGHQENALRKFVCENLLNEMKWKELEAEDSKVY